jgi:CRP/FNR family transcriptional regulator, nitrogen oxide reductase regulator
MTAAGRHRALMFESLPADVAECCVRLGQSMTAVRGTVLARQGDEAVRCYYVRSGYAKVTSAAPDGQEILVGFVGPRDVIGQAAATESGDRYLATTAACEAMELVGWSRDTALQLAERFPDVHARLDALLFRNAEVLVKRLHTVGQGRVPQRLASALLELSARHGTRDPIGIALGPRVTREDLAALTGSTLYTVSRVLAAWQRQGLLTSHRGRMHLIAPSRLRVLARGDANAATSGGKAGSSVEQR